MTSTLNSRHVTGDFDPALAKKGIVFGSLDRLLVRTCRSAASVL